MKQNDMMLHKLAGLVVFIIFSFAIFLLLAGHNAPGGGFIGGLMTAVAFVILYVSFDMEKIDKVLKFDYTVFIAIGLLFAMVTGVSSIFLGYPFLTHFFGYIEFPFLGEVELTTALPFDLGVYFVVVAAAMTIILTIARDEV